ncbi:glucosyltransferase [Sporothrix stenoceras]|uniref:Dol-P-Glc:Glc(2)Man(9)GlcNAc(2)-PP-Dol alpha-1,2-glucosyltransferase n=1 Tax=Sporothrix stenoceras TaxID=5173 RepID=A0ABR3YL53_9PEZI
MSADSLVAANATTIDDPKLKAFLASAVFVLPWLVWQAFVLGTSFRQRRGNPVSDTNALAEGAAKLQAAAKAAKEWGEGSPDAGSSDAPAATPAEPTETAQTTETIPTSSSRGRPLLFMAGASLLFMFTKAWLARVLAIVPEPYLDEFFHVPQAQKYCARLWYDWDDKITTPPGLYLVSVALETMWSGLQDGCHIWALRGANSVAIMLVAVTASSCRAALEQQNKIRNSDKTKKISDSLLSLFAFHTGLNAALFPALFFFSALYYTDVYSTLVVLLAYRLHLFRVSIPANVAVPAWSDMLAIFVGFAALGMRQTNVFWIVVYLGGLEIVQAAKIVHKQPANRAALRAARDETFDSFVGMIRLYAWRYSLGDVHDPPLATSWPHDWALSLVSVAVAATSNPFVIVQRAWPYAAVVLGFVQFVVWNGGVVLGDKANHVATIHAAQLLYLWPLLAFFSVPLFVTHGLYYVGEAWKTVNGAKETSGEKEAENAPPLSYAAFPNGDDNTNTHKLLRLLHVVFVNKAYYPVYLVVVFDAMLAVVYFNTLIHPFTLADNRHYMFYVFRYTIRRSIVIRYALVPVYALTAWACWRILYLGFSNGSNESAGDYISSPFASGQTAIAGEETDEKEGADTATASAIDNKKLSARQRKELKTPKKGKKAKKAAKAEEEEEVPFVVEETGPPAVFLGFLDEDEDGSATASRTGPTTTTALLWLLATSLSLVTAPLVEPRYFILPWVFWRLLVPAATPKADTNEKRTFVASVLDKIDARLFLETAWFVAINVVTMWVFLFRPFVWRGQDGSLLDGGRLQRFMW